MGSPARPLKKRASDSEIQDLLLLARETRDGVREMVARQAELGIELRKTLEKIEGLERVAAPVMLRQAYAAFADKHAPMMKELVAAARQELKLARQPGEDMTIGNDFHESVSETLEEVMKLAASEGKEYDPDRNYGSGVPLPLRKLGCMRKTFLKVPELNKEGIRKAFLDFCRDYECGSLNAHTQLDATMLRTYFGGPYVELLCAHC